MSDDDLMTQAAAFPPEEPEASSKRGPGPRAPQQRHPARPRRRVPVRRVRDPAAADRRLRRRARRVPRGAARVAASSCSWSGIAAWVTEGMALNAVLPELGIVRGTRDLPVDGRRRLARSRARSRWRSGSGCSGAGASASTAPALGLTINGLATQASKLILPALAVLLLTISRRRSRTLGLPARGRDRAAGRAGGHGRDLDHALRGVRPAGRRVRDPRHRRRRAPDEPARAGGPHRPADGLPRGGPRPCSSTGSSRPACRSCSPGRWATSCCWSRCARSACPPTCCRPRSCSRSTPP